MAQQACTSEAPLLYECLVGQIMYSERSLACTTQTLLCGAGRSSGSHPLEQVGAKLAAVPVLAHPALAASAGRPPGGGFESCFRYWNTLCLPEDSPI